ncbi:hypothetical protein TNCV_4525691 [Trichonephila clavipes]|nr:hypothetical protein TNCV_4525691 [Trichonephila clavipes]
MKDIGNGIKMSFRTVGSLVVVKASDSRPEGLGRVAIYHSFEEFRRANSLCHLYGAQGQRQAYFQPLATMNFVDLVLTASDRWH